MIQLHNFLAPACLSAQDAILYKTNEPVALADHCPSATRCLFTASNDKSGAFELHLGS